MSDQVEAIKAAIYQQVVSHTTAPSVEQIATALRLSRPETLAAFAALAAARVLVLEPDGETIRMAPPFSAVETQHRVEANCKQYSANCAWDALGIVATLGVDAEIDSRCEQSLESLNMKIREAAMPSDAGLETWRFHTPVRASHWWDDIRHT